MCHEDEEQGFAIFVFTTMIIGSFLVRDGVKAYLPVQELFDSFLTLAGDDGPYYLKALSICIILLGVCLILSTVASLFTGCSGVYHDYDSGKFKLAVFVTRVFFILAMVAWVSSVKVFSAPKASILSELPKAQSLYYAESPNKENVVQAWDSLQKLGCCGISNFTEWARVQNAPLKEFIPASCCYTIRPHCTENITRENMNGKEARSIVYTHNCTLTVNETTPLLKTFTLWCMPFIILGTVAEVCQIGSCGIFTIFCFQCNDSWKESNEEVAQLFNNTRTNNSNYDSLNDGDNSL